MAGAVSREKLTASVFAAKRFLSGRTPCLTACVGLCAFFAGRVRETTPDLESAPVWAVFEGRLRTIEKVGFFKNLWVIRGQVRPKSHAQIH